MAARKRKPVEQPAGKLASIPPRIMRELVARHGDDRAAIAAEWDGRVTPVVTVDKLVDEQPAGDAGGEQ